ncbi:MAG: thiamine-phosphate kinase [Rikenellaceae bacterium]
MAKHRTEISTIGEFGLIDRLMKPFSSSQSTTVKSYGDDAAVISTSGDELILTSTDTLLEGVDFDLTYFPLKHLGYKAVVVGINDILAMNGLPHQIMISLGVSSKMAVESLEDLYEGVAAACKDFDVDLVGGDMSSSLTGLVIGITAIGRTSIGKIAYRDGAKPNDLICITGNLGAAYMGLHLLEREKRVLAGVNNPQPQFEGYEYLLQSYLKPHARRGVVESMAEEEVVPTSMIDLSDGLASDLLQLCKSSNCGARIYLERIPIAKQTSALAAEMNIDPVVAALNGGEDHELMFTIPLSAQESVAKLGCIDIIGHITERSKGAYLVTPDGSDIEIQSPAHPTGL